ncbi:hypothetical protein [Uliginosibacterium sp. TH139]|uniref:hypothetical protein n=1 Tax=Uliginosibacterium sp. TH139 TaxID=2067453 RepID=UPI000C7D649B|nr:hypothetical protein [Uliginosibacterium sp. TH139]PLK49969.1 hypothetical protein C0V76_06040 [Uliginosibacterium sp. TH139]
MRFMFPVYAVATLLMALVATNVCAATLEAGVLKGQVQVQMEKGLVSGCGLRITGFDEGALQAPTMRLIDVSVMVYTKGMGLIKGLAYKDVKPSLLLSGSPALKKSVVKEFWMKAGSQPALSSQGGKAFRSSETPGALLSGADFVESLRFLAAGISGVVVQVGIQRESDPVAFAYYGEVNLSEQDRSQALSCLNEFKSQLLE